MVTCRRVTSSSSGMQRAKVRLVSISRACRRALAERFASDDRTVGRAHLARDHDIAGAQCGIDGPADARADEQGNVEALEQLGSRFGGVLKAIAPGHHDDANPAEGSNMTA